MRRTLPSASEHYRMVTALAARNWEATAPLVYEEQLALMASIEGSTTPETATMLAEGVPPGVRAEFWQGFVDGYPAFAEEEVADLQVGEVELFVVDGQEFGAVNVTLRRTAGAGSWVTRRADDGRWRVDIFASFGPAFASPLRDWLETVAEDDQGRLIRETLAAQAPSFNSALTREPLGELTTDVRFEVQLLIAEANS